MITISNKAYKQIQAIVQVADEEVGWFGFATFNKNESKLKIHEMFMPVQQKSEPAYCEIQHDGDNDIIDWEIEMRKIYGNGSAIAWFHSHVNMDTFASGQDEKQFKELSKGQEIFVRAIVNKQMKIHFTVSVLGFTIDNPVFEIEIDPENPFLEETTAKYKQIREYHKEHFKKAYVYHGNYGSTSGYKQQFLDDYYDDVYERYYGIVDEPINGKKKKKEKRKPERYYNLASFKRSGEYLEALKSRAFTKKDVKEFKETTWTSFLTSEKDGSAILLGLLNDDLERSTLKKEEFDIIVSIVEKLDYSQIYLAKKMEISEILNKLSEQAIDYSREIPKTENENKPITTVLQMMEECARQKVPTNPAFNMDAYEKWYNIVTERGSKEMISLLDDINELIIDGKHFNIYTELNLVKKVLEA